MGRILIGQTLGLNDIVDLLYPIGGNPYVQFPNTPTPAEIFPNTFWEIDTDYAGRTLVGSGNGYEFGATGGTKTYNADLSRIVAHVELANSGVVFMDSLRETWYANYQVVTNGKGNSLTGTQVGSGAAVGGNLTINTEQPYKVVNVWKRTA